MSTARYRYRGATALSLLLIIALHGCATPARQQVRGLRPGASWGEPATPYVASDLENTPDLSDHPTLDEYRIYAALHNAAVRAAFDTWQAAVQRVPQAESLPDPKVSYAYFIQSVETRVGPMRQKVGLSQTFPFYGKRRLRGSVAADQANAALERLEFERLALAYRVEEAYHEYAYLKRALDVVADNIKLLESLEEVVRTRYKTGAASNADLLKLHVELGKIANERASLEELRAPLTARLNAALNRPTDPPLPWPQADDAPEALLDEQALVNQLPAANPELRALAAEIEQARAGVELARKEYYPDFTLGVEYTDVGSARRAKPMSFSVPSPAPADPEAPPSPPQQVTIQPMLPGDSGKDVWTVLVMFNLPLWHDRLRAGVAEAGSTLAAAEARRQEKENDLLARLKLALYKRRDARRQVRLYRDTLIPRAEQSLRATQAAYVGGSTPFTDVIDAQRTLLAFHLAHRRAEADLAQRTAEIETLVGSPVAPSQNTLSTGDTPLPE